MTSSIVADTLPKSIAIKSNHYSDKGHVYYQEGGPVLLGEASVFSTLVKIEVEPAADNKYHFSLRFSYTNRYWARSSSKSVVAESNQPEEDTTKASCTLFEATAVGVDSGTFYLTHVHSGGRVLFNQGASTTAMDLYVEEKFDEEQGYLTLVDWGTIVKLPAHVAIKGSNGKYLQPSVASLTFTGDDPNAVLTSFAVYPMDDGYVRIRMYDGAMFCGLPDLTIDAVNLDAINLLLHSDYDEERTHFWPVKIDDESTIALRNKIGGHFWECHKSVSGIFYLQSASTTITQDARLLVEELVLQRKVYNVRYQMEYARIFDEAPYVAGSGTLANDGDETASMEVSVAYQDSKSSTFSRSTNLKVGVKTSITCGFPFIAEGKVEVSAEVGTTLTWGTTTTETKTVTAKGSVPVPARSRVVVDYVGTKGTCNIPFSYVQEDQRSTDGGTERVEEVDGIFTGVNCYNFDFHVRKVEALA